MKKKRKRTPQRISSAHSFLNHSHEMTTHRNSPITFTYTTLPSKKSKWQSYSRAFRRHRGIKDEGQCDGDYEGRKGERKREKKEHKLLKENVSRTEGSVNSLPVTQSFRHFRLVALRCSPMRNTFIIAGIMTAYVDLHTRLFPYSFLPPS